MKGTQATRSNTTAREIGSYSKNIINNNKHHYQPAVNSNDNIQNISSTRQAQEDDRKKGVQQL